MNYNNSRKFLLLLVPLVCIAGLLTSCGTGGGGDSGGGINSQADAVATAIEFQILDAAPYYTTGTTTWNNTIRNGYISGTATVNGTFTKTYNAYTSTTVEDYDNVTISFNNFCTQAFYPHLTGSAVIDGSVTCVSSGGNYYSGYWEASGTLTLSQKHACSLTFVMRIYESAASDVAIINVNGTQWTSSYP